MGRVSTKTEGVTPSVSNIDEINSIKKENENLRKMVEELYEKLSSKPQEAQVIQNNYSIMDSPCTIIHLKECEHNLENTIKIGDTNRKLSHWGERVTIRYQDAQKLVSDYRSWFDRGILVLGEDCEVLAEQSGMDFRKVPLQIDDFNKMHILSEEKFKSFINSLNSVTVLGIAEAWVKRLDAGEPGYKDLNKMKILNKKTNGFMDKVIEEVAKERD